MAGALFGETTPRMLSPVLGPLKMYQRGHGESSVVRDTCLACAGTKSEPY